MNGLNASEKMPVSTPAIRFIRHTGAPTVYRAGWVVKDPRTILENAGILAADGKIREVPATGAIRGPVTDCGPGILMPALVNAHLHLELSALKGRLPLGKGFAPWVAALLRERDLLGTPALTAAARGAAASLPDLGTGVVGEVSTLGITRDLLSSAGTAGVWFQEFLGAGDPSPVLEKGFPLSFSAAGHAPHTTAPDLLVSLKHRTRAAGLPFSIHAAESDVETAFIAGTAGKWHDFLAARGIDARAWPVGGKTPVAYLDDLGVLGPDTLGVHLLQVTDRDLAILAETRTRICLCPRSNLHLHGRLPDICAMFEKNLAPALGTDSLASCDSLSLFDEMAFVRHHCPGLCPADILAMATKNGADALGVSQHFGTLDPGRQAALIYLDPGGLTRANLLEKVVNYGTG